MIIRNSNRRSFLKKIGTAGAASLFLQTPELFAEQLTLTPSQTEGPYYPPTLPLDTDNDLVVINNTLTSAVGQITYVSGRVLNPNGEPVRNAYIEIWHADASGRYFHPSDPGYATRDQNFQGFGRFITASTGEYFFRTIKPGLYTGRTRHIHYKVKASGMPEFTSQLYFLGEPGNANDGVLSGINNAKQRASVIVPFVAIEGSTIGAIAGRFDIVLSNSATAIPVMVIANTANAARNPAFRAGDNWRLDVTGASAGAPVFLHLWKDNVDLGVSGPYGVSDSTGTWSLAGGFGANDVGSWQLQAVVGASNSTQTSAPLALNISAN